jgi:hypothetical protein
METIKQKIQEKRREYERKRRKKYLYFKHIGRLDLYEKRKTPKLTKPIKKLKLSWWKRLFKRLLKIIKKLWKQKQNII